MSKTPNLNSGAALVVAIGAASFGFLGIPVRFLGDNGFSAMDITVVRHLVTAVALFVIILVVDRSLLRARPRDALLFALFGAFKLMSDVTLFKSPNAYRPVPFDTPADDRALLRHGPVSYTHLTLPTSAYV